MKEILKKTGALLPALLIAGCSAELPEPSVEDAAGAVASTTAAAVRRAANDAQTLRGVFYQGGATGWADGDSVSIYTLGSMLHNVYTLSDGAGTAEGTFVRTSGKDNYTNSGQLYGLTNCRYLYSISATMEGQAQIAVTLPWRLTFQDVCAAAGTSRMPIPYWSPVSFASDGKLRGEFRGLTAMLRVDLQALPEDTRAVVLTTHSYTDLNEGSLDEGDGEALSGTFSTVLEEGAALAVNPIFTSRDTLRVAVDRQSADYRYVYIPVISNRYSRLHVIAVTGDTKYRYDWRGALLQTFTSATAFEPNTIVDLDIDTGIRPVRR
jgi:hypothetical protein